MENTFTYVINAAPSAHAGVVQRELVVTIDGNVNATTVWPGHAVDLGTVRAPQASTVGITVTDVAGDSTVVSRSDVEFAATDVQPNLDGAINVFLVGGFATIE